MSAAAQEASADRARVDRVSGVIAAYDSQGVHRTATDVDTRSAAWLVEQAQHAGATATREAFTLSRVDVQSAFVQVGDRRVRGLPLFDGGFTPETGVRGRLGTPAAAADIAFVEVDQAAISSEGRALAQLRRSGSHRAIVAVTRGAYPGLTPMNAGAFTTPFGVPVLQVASTEAEWLADSARAGAEAHYVAHAVRTSAEAFNVVATVNGRNPALAPVVVITPRSGWWQCAAERGGGIACWLEAIAAVKQASTARSAIFTASSGHELGHLGLDAFLERRRELVKSASAWVHLGANIGAARGRPRLQASDDEMEQRAASALTGAKQPVEQRVARGTVPAGEARNLHVGGARYVSLLGSSPFFHSEADRWPDAVDAAAVARYAEAIARLVVALSS